MIPIDAQILNQNIGWWKQLDRFLVYDMRSQLHFDLPLSLKGALELLWDVENLLLIETRPCVYIISWDIKILKDMNF